MTYRYSMPEMLEGLERPDFTQFSGNIVLWGAGKIGSVVAHVLKQKGITALAFVDINERKQDTVYCGLPIISPESFLKNYSNAHLIITTVGRDDVVEWLKTNHFSLYYDAWSLLLEFDFGDYSEQNQMYMVRMIDRYFRTILRCYKINPKYVAERLKSIITSKCSLRCKECIMAMPFLKSSRHISCDEVILDIKTVLDAIGHFDDLELFGGEPFLHPELDKIIAGLHNESRVNTICIATNGTLLPTPESIEAMKRDSRILIRVSNYGSISKKCAELEELLNKNNVSYETKNFTNWYKRPLFGKTDENDVALTKKFMACMNGCGPLIWDGKLFLCACPWVFIETAQPIEANDSFLDLRNDDISSSELKQSIYDYINRTNTGKFITACRYCSGSPNADFANEIPAAKQFKE